MRTVPDHIPKPEWADTGTVLKKPLYPQPLNIEDQVNIREVGKLARHILDFAASKLKVSRSLFNPSVFVCTAFDFLGIAS